MKPPNHGMRVRVTGSQDRYVLTGWPLYTPRIFGKRTILGNTIRGLIRLVPEYEGQRRAHWFTTDRVEVLR